MSDKELLNITASQYPHRMNYITRFIRSILSFSPQLGIIPYPARPEGISVLMRVKDEADWIKSSVESIKRIADEIVIVDNGSTDGTYEMLEEISSKENALIKLWRRSDLNYCDLSNFALKNASFKWIFKWDGDMIARTSGEYDIAKLRNRILSLNPKRYYIIYLSFVNLAGDLSHQDPNEMVHIEEYIYTYSNSVRYIHPGRFEAVKFPKYYHVLFWYEPYSFHVNVKPAHRMLLRYFWEDWMELKDYINFPTLDDYVKAKIQSEFGTTSWDEAQRIIMRKTFSNYIRFDTKVLGPYPDLLRIHLENTKYNMIYENGKITGREES
jgi:glycosyltransferase involved in cell wall biosynthesis